MKVQHHLNILKVTMCMYLHITKGSRTFTKLLDNNILLVACLTACTASLHNGIQEHVHNAYYHADIDECSASTGLCPQQALCMNTDGNYTCTCNSGYTGDGEACNGKLVCVRL